MGEIRSKRCEGVGTTWPAAPARPVPSARLASQLVGSSSCSCLSPPRGLVRQDPTSVQQRFRGLWVNLTAFVKDDQTYGTKNIFCRRFRYKKKEFPSGPSKSAPSQLTIWPSLLLFFPRPAPCFFATSELYVVKSTTCRKYPSNLPKYREISVAFP